MGNAEEENEFILIKSIESMSEVSYKISETESKIGRHSSNSIVIFDESVSRFHAKIEKTSSGFYLKDVGSTTGTFIRIETPIELRPKVIIEIGSYQLIVNNVFIRSDQVTDQDERSFVEFEIYESPDDNHLETFRLYDGTSIGRKTNNSLCFNEDLHMSNLHCKIQLISRK
jgi:pSer/pThr/pTyr-binding forkhead associated (FHA) protein